MSLSVGIVGLPNVGKSTLFNALLKQQQALAANYPFATIEPNIGVVPVPDSRLERLAQIVNTTVIKPATVEFVDIAGLVKGASQGEGLGNQFLAHIREVNLIAHVLRGFSDQAVLREGSVDPIIDKQTIELELQLSDLTTIEKQKAPKATTDKVLLLRWQIIQKFRQWLENGLMLGEQISAIDHLEDRSIYKKVAHELGLLTAKPMLFVINVDEHVVKEHEALCLEWSQQLATDRNQIVVISAQIESELSSLSEEDQSLFLQDLGLDESGLQRLIKKAYVMLGLQSFLTAGEKEVKAWTIKNNTTAPQAAGTIHTDFEKKFIKAKVVDYENFILYDGWKGAKEKGVLRLEGKEYIMKEGDVVEFMIGT